MPTRLSAPSALERLREGNARHLGGRSRLETLGSPEQRERVAHGQSPIAIVLGCSDSRVPVEIVFDQGFGDLFVIRVAGNVVAPSQIGSVEFAAEQFGTRLVVVLGHSRCGAVEATLAALASPDTPLSPALQAIVSRIAPSLQPLMSPTPPPDATTLGGLAVRANVEQSVHQLRTGSPVLEELMREDGLMIVGAEYSLDTGQVRFFDEADASPATRGPLAP